MMAYFVVDCYPKTADFEPSRFFTSLIAPLNLVGQY